MPMRWPRPAGKDPTSFRWWRMPVLARRRIEIEIGSASVRVRAGVDLALLGKVLRLLKAIK